MSHIGLKLTDRTIRVAVPDDLPEYVEELESELEACDECLLSEDDSPDDLCDHHRDHMLTMIAKANAPTSK